jgi:hypothetical protein
MRIKILVAILSVLTGCVACSTDARAEDCNFDDGFDAMVVRFAWPPAVGFNALGFIDIEAGYGGGFSVCQNASVNVLGGVCLIPGADDALGFLCPSTPPPPPPPSTPR